jgi:protein-disulfide isomerase
MVNDVSVARIRDTTICGSDSDLESKVMIRARCNRQRPVTTALLGILLVFCLPASAPVMAQSATSPDGQILEELRQMRLLLERLVNQNPPVARPTTVNGGDGETVTLRDLTGYAIGRSDAPVTIVEFTDLQCPFCSEFHATAFEELLKNYIVTGKVRYISRDLPLPVHR